MFDRRGALRRAVPFTQTARNLGAGDEFGRLVPLSQVVIHFISFKVKIDIGMIGERNRNTIVCRYCSPQNGAEMRPLQ
jgi:hypothetical protein